MRRHFRRRRPRLSVKGLKTVFQVGVTLCIIALSVTVLIRIDKNGLSAVQTDFSSAKNSLKGIATVFASSDGEETLQGIKEIIEQTYMGQAQYVSKSVQNPFEGAILPLSATSIISGFGFRKDPFTEKTAFHSGVDLAADEGTEVFAVENGTVKSVDQNDIGGNFIEIQHENGYISYYGHLLQTNVKSGDSVQKGSVIALSGNTGKTTGAHLHFELKYNSRAVNPAEYFDVYEQS